MYTCFDYDLRVPEILPSQPEDVQVEVNSSSRISITWNKPSANSASVKEFVVNVTMLRSFDDTKSLLENDDNSQSVVTPHSIQVKVNYKNIILLSQTPGHGICEYFNSRHSPTKKRFVVSAFG